MQMLSQESIQQTISAFVKELKQEASASLLTRLLIELETKELPLLGFLQNLKPFFVGDSKGRSRAALLVLQVLRRKKDFLAVQAQGLVLLNFFIAKVLDYACVFQALSIIDLIAAKVVSCQAQPIIINQIASLLTSPKFQVSLYERKVKAVCYRLFRRLLQKRELIRLQSLEQSCCGGGCGSCENKAEGRLIEIAMQIFQSESSPENCVVLFRTVKFMLSKFESAVLQQYANRLWEFLDVYYPIDYDETSDVKKSHLEDGLMWCRCHPLFKNKFLKSLKFLDAKFLMKFRPSSEAEVLFQRVLGKELNEQGVEELFVRVVRGLLEDQKARGRVMERVKSDLEQLSYYTSNQRNFQIQKYILLAQHSFQFCFAFLRLLLPLQHSPLSSLVISRTIRVHKAWLHNCGLASSLEHEQRAQSAEREARTHWLEGIESLQKGIKVEMKAVELDQLQDFQLSLKGVDPSAQLVEYIASNLVRPTLTFSRIHSHLLLQQLFLGLDPALLLTSHPQILEAFRLLNLDSQAFKRLLQAEQLSVRAAAITVNRHYPFEHVDFRLNLSVSIWSLLKREKDRESLLRTYFNCVTAGEWLIRVQKERVSRLVKQYIGLNLKSQEIIKLAEQSVYVINELTNVLPFLVPFFLQKLLTPDPRLQLSLLHWLTRLASLPEQVVSELKRGVVECGERCLESEVRAVRVASAKMVNKWLCL